MKIAVLGATGMLGCMLVDYLSNYFEVVVTVRKGYKPLANVETRYLEEPFETVAKALEGCQWAINAIGAIPQRVSSNAEMLLTNAKFPAELAKVSSCPVIQIATDCVYSGEKGNYKETDRPDPIDSYGESKLKGEVEAPNMHHIRCSIVGPERHRKSLLGRFLSLPSKATVPGYANHYWNGLTTLHFAKICRGIIENSIPLPHMHHLVPADSVSKWKLLKLFANEFGRKDVVIEPTKAIETIYRTPATTNPKLNQELWQAVGYDYPPTIAKMVKALAEYIRR